MKARLINVRLDEEHLRKVRMLRREGIVLSQLVREAIDGKYEEIMSGERTLDAQRLIEDLFAEHPDPADLPPRDYDVHDQRAARAAIRRKLSGRRD